jgi:hypothetical protein
MANQYTAQSGQREAILKFVRERGLCTTLDIRAAFGWDVARIGNVLTRLRFDGLVENEKQEGTRTAVWAPTADLGDKADHPIRIHRQQWVGHGRDAMLTAFFGAPA